MHPMNTSLRSPSTYASLAQESNLLPGVPKHELSHHLAHAWSVVAQAPFERGLVVVMDGMGETYDAMAEAAVSAEGCQPSAFRRHGRGIGERRGAPTPSFRSGVKIQWIPAPLELRPGGWAFIRIPRSAVYLCVAGTWRLHRIPRSAGLCGHGLHAAWPTTRRPMRLHGGYIGPLAAQACGDQGYTHELGMPHAVSGFAQQPAYARTPCPQASADEGYTHELGMPHAASGFAQQPDEAAAGKGLREAESVYSFEVRGVGSTRGCYGIGTCLP